MKLALSFVFSLTLVLMTGCGFKAEESSLTSNEGDRDAAGAAQVVPAELEPEARLTKLDFGPVKMNATKELGVAFKNKGKLIATEIRVEYGRHVAGAWVKDTSGFFTSSFGRCGTSQGRREPIAPGETCVIKTRFSPDGSAPLGKSALYMNVIYRDGQTKLPTQYALPLSVEVIAPSPRPSFPYNAFFSRPEDWVSRAGKISIADNKAVGAMASVSVLSGLHASDVELVAEIDASAAAHRCAGLTARYRGGESGDTDNYSAWVCFDGRKTYLRIDRNQNGIREQLALAEGVAVAKGEMRFRVQGSHLSLTLRGSHLGESFRVEIVKDDAKPLPPGTVGIRSHGNGAVLSTFSADNL